MKQERKTLDKLIEAMGLTSADIAQMTTDQYQEFRTNLDRAVLKDSGTFLVDDQEGD